jgi:hypothetical protein
MRLHAIAARDRVGVHMSEMLPSVSFNTRPRIERVTFANGDVCHVIDDALLEPERLVAWAAAHNAAFRPIDFNAYPGNYLMPPGQLNEALQAFFNQHMRGRFDARRLVQMHCRLAMVTLPPSRLRPYQWLCHSDNFALERSQSIQASVLYLFKDVALGGTGFYQPTRSPSETRQLFADSATLSSEDFTQRHGIQPGYIHASNAYFARIGHVPARWNRLIFYDGSLLHSDDITAPDKLSPDPLKGRLTLNGFFTCRRHAV